MATFSERSVEIGVVGLGECGCNLAVEFDRLGYAAVALNTSYTDLRGLPLTEKLYVGTNGRDGAGQDVLLGGQYLDANAEEILDRVQSIADGCDHILLTAGLGGGTGSNVITLANLISKLGRPISVFATLPKNQEGSIAKVNAVQAVSQFNDTDVTSVVLVDNEKILLQFGSNSLTTFYHNANSSVVNTLHEMNSLAHDTGLTPVRGFDGEDFRRVFTARGTLIYGQADLKREDLTVEDQLANGLQTIWDNAGLLAAGFDYQDATMAGIVLVAPESLLAQA
ncbi:MAG: hypothetical protein QGH20_03800, partial [Candidatus Latescibacteria bacterium]|nr:hypothetical protein [Candidatus Latescibacterota bacterium]